MFTAFMDAPPENALYVMNPLPNMPMIDTERMNAEKLKLASFAFLVSRYVFTVMEDRAIPKMHMMKKIIGTRASVNPIITLVRFFSREIWKSWRSRLTDLGWTIGSIGTKTQQS